MVKSFHAGLADLLQRVLGELDDLLHRLCRRLGTTLGKIVRKMHYLIHAKITWLKKCLFCGLETQISSMRCLSHYLQPSYHWLYIPVCPQTCPRLG